MEDQVAEILKSIKPKEVRTNKQIKEKNAEVLEELYGNFMSYKHNVVNRQMATMDLEDYELVPLECISKGDSIIYFKTKFFYNLKHMKGSAINILKGDRLSLRVRGTIVHIKCKYYFRKLTDEDKVKISLEKQFMNHNKIDLINF